MSAPFYTHFAIYYASFNVVAGIGYSLIFLATLCYYVPLVRKLEFKNFQVGMIGLIAIATVLELIGFAFAQSMFIKLQNPTVTVADIIADYRGFKICVAFWISLTGLAHAIFVVKYWLLSEKVKNIIQNKTDRNLEKKHALVLASLTFMIFVSFGFEIFINLTIDPANFWLEVSVTIGMMIP